MKCKKNLKMNSIVWGCFLRTGDATISYIAPSTMIAPSLHNVLKTDGFTAMQDARGFILTHCVPEILWQGTMTRAKTPIEIPDEISLSFGSNSRLLITKSKGSHQENLIAEDGGSSQEVGGSLQAQSFLTLMSIDPELSTSRSAMMKELEDSHSLAVQLRGLTDSNSSDTVNVISCLLKAVEIQLYSEWLACLPSHCLVPQVNELWAAWSDTPEHMGLYQYMRAIEMSLGTTYSVPFKAPSSTLDPAWEKMWETSTNSTAWKEL